MVKKTSWLKQDSIEGLIPHAKEMAEYILKKRFKLVLVGGVSAQTAAYMVKAVLKEKGVPIEAMPTFLTLGRANLKQRMPERTGGVYLTPKDIANFLRKKYPHQIKNTNQKLFILEESIESGYAMTKLKKAVKLLLLL